MRSTTPHTANEPHIVRLFSPKRSRYTTRVFASAPTETDVVVIGAGIGGLSSAAILSSTYGFDVTVLESHSIAGGAAQAFTRDGFHFECGPSLYSGMDATGQAANPLSHVLQAIGEPLELLEYKNWNVLFPEIPEGLVTKVGSEGFDELLRKVRGEGALKEWSKLRDYMTPLAAASTALPPAALRADPGVLFTGLGRYAGSLLPNILTIGKLTGPFSDLLDEAGINDPFIRNYLDLLCFLLSGQPASGTIAAEVCFMFAEWYSSKESTLQFPKGGSTSMVDALVRGVEKAGGRVLLKSHVAEICIDENTNTATGVKLRNGTYIKVRKAVVSNASTYDTLKLLPETSVSQKWRQEVESTPLNPSFMHLHLGFDASGLDTLEMHHLVVDSWDVTAPSNVVLISIPSIVDPELAPPGKHCLHAYYPATEPYSIWQGVKRGTDEYKKLKEERSQQLWRAVERIIPDIKQRIEFQAIGSPLTHERYLRRHRGSYGPLVLGQTPNVGGSTPIKGLYCCGDFTFPGIGLPAVAASGMIVANTLAPVESHKQMLQSLGI